MNHPENFTFIGNMQVEAWNQYNESERVTFTVDETGKAIFPAPIEDDTEYHAPIPWMIDYRSFTNGYFPRQIYAFTSEHEYCNSSGNNLVFCEGGYTVVDL